MAPEKRENGRWHAKQKKYRSDLQQDAIGSLGVPLDL